MNVPLTIGLTPWLILIGFCIAVRDDVHLGWNVKNGQGNADQHRLSRFLFVLSAIAFLAAAGILQTLASPLSDCAWACMSAALAMPVFGWVWENNQGHHRAMRDRINQETSWIIWKRGNVQNEIMRAREHEAMDRRLRRCRSALLLSRGDAQDFDFLFGELEGRLLEYRDDADQCALLVGGIAAHLRHVFMERDQDDIPVAEACRHVNRWAQWLRTMGIEGLEVLGTPAQNSPTLLRKVPSMLFLGAAERMGIAALEHRNEGQLQWHWTFTESSARLSASGSPHATWSNQMVKDWDAAFMLRHGGIAHAGGIWHCELPLLPA